MVIATENKTEPFEPAGRKWSKKDTWTVLGMIEKGKSNQEIAEVFGVSPNAIAHFKRDRDMPRRSYQKWTQPQLNEIKRLLAAGRSAMQIADELKIKYNRLERCIAYYKLRGK